MGNASPDTLTFLMVGCQRCGTSWVNAALSEHPEVFLPAKKQTYFFDRNYDRGIGWYLEKFNDVQPQHTAVGEVATGYSLKQAVPLMASHFPTIKLIMTMRHPVDRAYSYYLSRSAERGWTSFEQALSDDPELLERGQYMEQIEALLEHYDREQLLLLFYDDLATDDAGYLRSILSFIGVDATFRSTQLGRQRNASMFPRARHALRRVGLGPVLKYLSQSRLGDIVRTTKKRWGPNGSKSIKPATRNRLVSHFQPYNDRLAEFTGRDLSSWNR